MCIYTYMHTYINFTILVIHFEAISFTLKFISTSSGKIPVGYDIIHLGRVSNQSSLSPGGWGLQRGGSFLGIGLDGFITGSLPIQGPTSRLPLRLSPRRIGSTPPKMTTESQQDHLQHDHDHEHLYSVPDTRPRSKEM